MPPQLNIHCITVWSHEHAPLFMNYPLVTHFGFLDGITEVLNAVQASKYGQWESADKKTFALSPVSYHAIADAIYKYAEVCHSFFVCVELMGLYFHGYIFVMYMAALSV